MMEDMWFYSGGYYVWWMIVNGIIYFFEVIFLQNIAGVWKRRYMLCYLLLSIILTFFAMHFDSPGIWRLVLHAGMAVGFSVFFLKLKGTGVLAPVAIILTMCTFMEGFQAVLMQWFVQQSIGPFMGATVQMAVSGGLAVLLAGGLCIVSAMMSGEIRERRQYLEEVKKRNERYREFQHDIDNHFLVLSGLLHEKRYREAESYSRSLGSLSEDLLEGIRTGNLAADVLLKEKISCAKAKGIHVSCDVHFSGNFVIEDTDLCILLSNAVDNAIQACVKEERLKADKMRPQISVTAGMRQHFLMINVTNGPEKDKEPSFGEKEYGTGLRNIKRVVKKYKGSMEI